MALLHRIFKESQTSGEEVLPDPLELDDSAITAEYQELKSRVHNQLFEHLDLAKLGKVSPERMAGDIAMLTRRILADERVLLTEDERTQIVEEVQHEVFGLGPLEPLLKDPSITDILVNGAGSVYVERHGRLERTVARLRRGYVAGRLDTDTFSRRVDCALSCAASTHEPRPLIRLQGLQGCSLQAAA